MILTLLESVAEPVGMFVEFVGKKRQLVGEADMLDELAAGQQEERVDKQDELVAGKQEAIGRIEEELGGREVPGKLVVRVGKLEVLVADS